MSKRYYCGRCELSFDEEELVPIESWYGESKYSSNNSGWYTEDMVCPHCHSSDDLEEAEECCCCGEDFGKEDYMIVVGNDWYCLECAKKIHDAYDEDQEKRRKFEEYWAKIREARARK